MKIKKEVEELFKKLKEKIRSKVKDDNYTQLVYYLINELDNPKIYRSLIFKDLTENTNELDLYRFIFSETGIPFIGAMKNFPYVATVLFKTCEHCKKVFEKLSKKDYYIKGRKVKIEKNGATKFNLLPTHVKRLQFINKLKVDVNYNKRGYDEIWYENEKLKRQLNERANKQFELEAKVSQLNEKIHGLLYNRESLKVHLDKDKKKKFEELKQKCIKKLQNFKL